MKQQSPTSVRRTKSRYAFYSVVLALVIGASSVNGAGSTHKNTPSKTNPGFNPDLILEGEADKANARLRKELSGFQRMSDADKEALGRDLLTKRIQGHEKAINRIERLVKLFKNRRPRRSVAKFDRVTKGQDPSMGYCKMQSLLDQFVRDWGSGNDNVRRTQHEIVLNVVKKHAADSNETGLGSVLVPGDALGRMSWDLNNLGVFSEVVANEASPLFAEFANFVLNCVEEPFDITPFADFMDNQESVGGHMRTVAVPTPMPQEPQGGPFTVTIGAFEKLFSKGGARYRKFDYVITCFFLDTIPGSIADALTIIADLLSPGGVWINYGPLLYRGTSYPKLSWEEVVALLPSRGFSIIESDHIMHAEYSQLTEDTHHPTIYNPRLLVARKAEVCSSPDTCSGQ